MELRRRFIFVLPFISALSLRSADGLQQRQQHIVRLTQANKRSNVRLTQAPKRSNNRIGHHVSTRSLFDLHACAIMKSVVSALIQIVAHSNHGCHPNVIGHPACSFTPLKGAVFVVALPTAAFKASGAPIVASSSAQLTLTLSRRDISR